MNLLLLFFLGYRIYEIPQAAVASFLDLCMRKRIPYSGFRSAGEFVTVRCSMTVARRMERSMEEYCIPYRTVASKGLPFFVRKYRTRAGIAVGILLMFCAWGYASGLVWDVRISGNETVSTADIRAELTEAGVKIGARISDLDADTTEMKLLLSSERIAWATLNVRGTVAYVQVREKQLGNGETGAVYPANLVASASGTVLYTEIMRGYGIVSTGTHVNAGDLLVSGIYPETQSGFRYTRAAGKVYARTVTRFHIEIPLTEERNVTATDGTCGLTLFFFGKDINLFKKSGNDTSNCDTMNVNKELVLPGGSILPISLTETVLQHTETVTVTRDEEEAKTLAEAQLERQLSDWLGEGYLLKKDVSVSYDGDKAVLDCVAVGAVNIAKIAEFTPNTVGGE